MTLTSSSPTARQRSICWRRSTRDENQAVFFVKIVFPKMGVQKSSSQAFARELFSSAFVLKMHQYSWNEETRTMTSPNDKQEKLDEAIRGQA